MRNLLFLFLLPLPLLYGMQNSSTNGSLTGTVHDTSGAVVAGALVSARSLTTNQTRQTSSTEDGSYRFAALPVGDYEIRIELAGFAAYVNPNLTVALGRTVLLDIRLNPAGITQDIAVT